MKKCCYLFFIILIIFSIFFQEINSYHFSQSVNPRIFHYLNRKSCNSRSLITFRKLVRTDQIEPPKEKPSNWKIDYEFLSIACPAFVSLVADPLASLVDAIYIGKLSPAHQGALGLAASAHYSIAKLYNDPLLKSSTSLVAGKENEELEASVLTAISSAAIIGFLQTFVFVFLGSYVYQLMGVKSTSEMYKPALDYLRWRAIGIPAATMSLVINGIFRGRGDTKTPLFCSLLSSALNIILDPLFIFTFKMGCAGAGVATAIAQWIAMFPLLYMLNKKVPLNFGKSKINFTNAFQAYLKASGYLFIRTLAKIMAYSITSSYAASLGTIAMAAYSVTFNIGTATTQLCESISIATQALLAREFPYDTKEKQTFVKQIINRSILYGSFISTVLTIITWFHQDSVISKLSKSSAVIEASKAIFPIVLFTQLLKGLVYSTGGVLLGGLDWTWSTYSMIYASIISIILVKIMPLNLTNIWVSLAVFMAVQIVISCIRFSSKTGPWKNIDFFSKENPKTNKII